VLSLDVRRNGKPVAIRLSLATAPATPAPDKRLIAGHNPFAGVTVVNVSPAAAQQYGVDPFGAQGVLVTEIGAGYAQSIGLQAGDYIRQVNGQKIATTADLAAALAAPANGWSVTIQRGQQTINARFSG
jgi:S1-C subfamily serine protease